ncbi:sulfate adenylyltransferase subunit CysN [Rhizobium sophoriradicis]|uniref:Sulfate adenylyltransferase subunit 1 n=1 Tax=Rhizobium sophoriradicis TaxID=1535245 RepID=A0A2A5KPV7_9HYPH|nr:sulfate adenylyltransferase subunit CysN [Rhizobium sophoriradicis]PCK78997.1 sulfate adenylyltransferase subunit CysN [Rhizobium sophoriradicis]
MTAANTAVSAATAVSLPAAEPQKAQRDSRPLRLITCGSVDDGKSTLIGRLLWDTKAVKEDQAATLQRDSTGKQNDLGLPDFALLLDGLQAEREQGITIDVAYRYFSTDKRSFIVADTPGHEQYTRNMATGASTADLAILLVDARFGILEQTRRHATIASLLGIKQFVLAVNKIDLTGYDRAGFDKISHEFREFALSLGVKQITAIPMSALKGENVVYSGQAAMPWYAGPTLVETLELATVRSSQTVGFRLSVQRVSRPGESFRGYQGTVAGGSVKPGDSVMILPSGMVANVSKIVTFDLVRNAAVAGDAITLVLDRQVDVARGDMIVSIDAQPQVGLAFDAQIVALQPEGIEPGKRYWLKSGSRRQRVQVQPLSQLELKTGTWNAAQRLYMNAIGKVRLSFDEAAIFDPYEQNRQSGSFILIDPETNNTVAGGMVIGKRTELGGLHNGDARVILSLPADLAEQIMASELFASRSHEAEVRRMTAAEAADLWSSAASDI